MSTKVSPFMGGLGRDVTSKLTITDDASVTVGDGTNGGNVAVGDNGVISFGAGSDLQITHDGSNSYLSDVGTGDLFISGSTVRIKASVPGAEDGVTVTGDGAVTLYYDNAPKLATTSSGIDVTGDVQGDGLIIDGTFDLGTL